MKKIFQRFLYLLYYLKQSELKRVKPFLKYASKSTGHSEGRLICDAIISVFRYNTSMKDYFYFRFFELDAKDRGKWAGTGFMYEYQLVMNSKATREVLEDKIRFLHQFQSFVKRKFLSLEEIKSNKPEIIKLLSNSSGRIVLKGSRGQVGAEVEVVSCKDYTPSSLIDYMTRKTYDLAEEYVVQHPSMMDLSPSGLNTVRIFTQLEGSKVDFIGARLRVSVNSPVDNMAAGNLAAPIDIEKGIVNDSGVYSDITKPAESVHPITGKSIVGFVIPFWNETLELVRKAAFNSVENRSIGWDIAITKDGPELIEGNHNWCKLLWQLPVKKGLKKELKKYL